ncbi:hypothetical protein JA1_004581 [Spathaspora sp. JA1]|nr:hypothetical protein JA1_004581 [Spathaspora sp. JA1]
MKVQSLSLIASVLSLATAFSDTALFYSSSNLQVPHKYITESNDLSQLVLQYTQQLCSSDKQLYIYRVSQLKRGEVKDGLLLNHVHYTSIDDVSLPIDSGCVVGDNNNKEANIVVVDVADGVAHSIDEFLNHDNVIVQGVPTFTENNKVQQVVQDEFEKRDGANFEQEIEADFREAEALVEDDETVTIFKSQIKETRASNDTGKNAGLFTNYQFFTPGIWSGIIVSFFLLSILYTGISWLNSLEVTYSSFEKQVDYDKKNE